MRFWLEVENFAKIEYAKICIDSYTVLVGQNNSGKTFLMQLAQGISKRLNELIDDDIVERVFVSGKNELGGYVLSEANLSLFIDYMNEKLCTQKELWVYEIFGKEIMIDKLAIDIDMDEKTEYELYIIDSENRDKIPYGRIIDKCYVYTVTDEKKDSSVVLIIKYNKTNMKRKPYLISHMFSSNISYRSIFDMLITRNSLFLPASRNGFMLLYREFFANKGDEQFYYSVKNGKLVRKNKEKIYSGTTQPVYEFLRFLQTYRDSEDPDEMYFEELEFFDKKLIEGHINVSDNGILSYHSNKSEGDIPMYLASSMINEIAPISMAAFSDEYYERLIIDEIEASLHPEKQMELVRFLNRLNNSGMRLILSTHSDTFVSKLNNLYVLGQLVNEQDNDDILKSFGLEKKDIVDPGNLFVYEFVLQENGKSIVREIVPDKKLGYQFDLFTKSAMNLYEEAMKLGEIQK